MAGVRVSKILFAPHCMLFRSVRSTGLIGFASKSNQYIQEIQYGMVIRETGESNEEPNSTMFECTFVYT